MLFWIFWSIISVVVVTWFPAGLSGARMIKGCISLVSGDCDDKILAPRTPIKTGKSQALFALGVILGWITIAFCLTLVVLGFVASACVWLGEKACELLEKIELLKGLGRKLSSSEKYAY